MRHTVALIDLNCLERNISRIGQIAPQSEIMAVIKANAYGHGMLRIAEKLDSIGIKMFGVAFADEGILLRDAGFKQEIIVLVPETNGNASLCARNNLSPVLYSLEFAIALSEAAVQAGITATAHLFVDTGMNREGLRPDKIPEFMNKASKLPNLDIIGICTHFATSTSDIKFASKQLGLFNSVLKELNNSGYSFKYVHAANSGGIINLPDSRFNVIRPGMTIYGYPPSYDLLDEFNLSPIMSLKTKVISVRKIFPGDTVGYGMEFISDKATLIATIPIGYGDGFFKSNAKGGYCLINGRKYFFVGTICMDVSMIDIGNDNIVAGDEVVLIGNQGDERITAYTLADISNTIPYEITTAISQRVPRVYL